MSTNNQNFSCIAFLIMLITFPAFFVSVCIARNEIKERFIYGDIVQSVVLEKGSYTSSPPKSTGSRYFTFKVKPIEKYKNFILETREKVGNPDVNNLEVGDTLTIKIQTERQAKIISIKGNKLNDKNTYFWLIAIPIIFSIGIFPYILLYKKGGKKHKTKTIKLLIICILTSCLIAHFFTS